MTSTKPSSTSTSSTSSGSSSMEMELANIESEVKNRSRGHITLENLYVVALISSWASTVLLLLLITGALMIYFWIPSHLSSTMTNALEFFGSISNGYLIGVHNLPPAKRTLTSSFEQVVSKYVQQLYYVPWTRLQSTLLNAQNIMSMLPICAQLAPIYSDIYELAWFVSAKIRVIPFIKDLTPWDYAYPSDNYFPYTVTVENSDDSDSDSAELGLLINGDFVDNSSVFAQNFNKSIWMNDHFEHQIILRDDDKYRWYLYKVEHYPSLISFVEDDEYQIMSVQFYEPVNNTFEILTLIPNSSSSSSTNTNTNTDQSLTFQSFENNKWLLRYSDEPDFKWNLYYKNLSALTLTASFDYIQPEKPIYYSPSPPPPPQNQKQKHKQKYYSNSTILPEIKLIKTKISQIQISSINISLNKTKFGNNNNNNNKFQSPMNVLDTLTRMSENSERERMSNSNSDSDSTSTLTLTENNINGVYKLTNQSSYWLKFQLFNSVMDLETCTTFIQEINDTKSKSNPNTRQFYRLKHRMIINGSINVHKWNIEKYVISKQMESCHTTNKTASIEAVKWRHITNHSQQTQNSTNTNTKKSKISGMKVSTKKDTLFRAPFIQLVILNYSVVRNSAKAKSGNSNPALIYHQLLCEPYLAIKMEYVYLKMRVDRNTRLQFIAAQLLPINVSVQDCIVQSQQQQQQSQSQSQKETAFASAAYLNLSVLISSSDLFGGRICGFAHVFFINQSICAAWVTQLNVVQANVIYENSLIDGKNWNSIKQRHPNFISSVVKAMAKMGFNLATAPISKAWNWVAGKFRFRRS